MTDKNETQDESVKVVAVGVEVVNEESSTNGDALVMMADAKSTFLHLPAKGMSPVDKVSSFVAVTRLSNAIERRKKELRKEIDTMFEDTPMTSKDREIRLETGNGFVVKKVNSAYGKTVLNKDKAMALLLKREQETGKPLVGACMVTPAPPPPHFSQEKFEALVTLGMLTADEVTECFDPAETSASVTVECSKELDEAIAKAVLGTLQEKPAKKLSKKKS